jgi:hypothetical protein
LIAAHRSRRYPGTCKGPCSTPHPSDEGPIDDIIFNHATKKEDKGLIMQAVLPMLRRVLIRLFVQGCALTMRAAAMQAKETEGLSAYLFMEEDQNREDIFIFEMG